MPFPALAMLLKLLLRVLPLISLLTACGSPEPAQDPTPDLVLADVTVVDGTGAAPREGQTIEITDGRISAIRSTSPADNPSIDVGGSFALPGLIDAHVHLPGDHSALKSTLDSMLHLGITSTREMGCCAPEYAEMRSRVDANKVTDLYGSAFWAGPPFLKSDLRWRDRLERYEEAGNVPWLLTVTDTTDLQAALRGARDSGVTGVKIYSNMKPPLVRSVAQTADDFDLRVWSHAAVFPTRPSTVVESGVDVISHAGFLIWEAVDELPETYNGGHPWNPFGPLAPYDSISPDNPEIASVLQTMREGEVILDPTISVMEYLSDEARAWTIEVTRLAHEMDVPICTGTDAASLFAEIEALVREVGLSPLEAVRSASLIGAAAIGIEEEVGSLEVGKVADIVVYPSDPINDIAVLRHPSHVIKGGQVVRPRP